VGEAAKKKRALGLVSPDGNDVTSGPRRSHPVTRDGKAIPFFPVGKRVVVERLPPETTVLGGLLHIPDTHQAPQQYATVIAAGPAAQGILDDMGIAIGDTICFGKYAGLFWEWQPDGTTTHADRRRVDIINVDDIFGGKELAEKMIDGRLGIDKVDIDTGLVATEISKNIEYRFLEEVEKR